MWEYIYPFTDSVLLAFYMLWRVLVYNQLLINNLSKYQKYTKIKNYWLYMSVCLSVRVATAKQLSCLELQFHNRSFYDEI